MASFDAEAYAAMIGDIEMESGALPFSRHTRSGVNEDYERHGNLPGSFKFGRTPGLKYGYPADVVGSTEKIYYDSVYGTTLLFTYNVKKGPDDVATKQDARGFFNYTLGALRGEGQKVSPTRFYNAIKNTAYGMRKQDFFRLVEGAPAMDGNTIAKLCSRYPETKNLQYNDLVPRILDDVYFDMLDSAKGMMSGPLSYSNLKQLGHPYAVKHLGGESPLTLGSTHLVRSRGKKGGRSKLDKSSAISVFDVNTHTGELLKSLTEQNRQQTARYEVKTNVNGDNVIKLRLSNKRGPTVNGYTIDWLLFRGTEKMVAHSPQTWLAKEYGPKFKSAVRKLERAMHKQKDEQATDKLIAKMGDL